MMDQLSPLTRRIVAVGLAVLALLLVIQLLVVPLIQAIGDQHDELAALRGRRARLQATAHRLMPDASTMPLGLAIVAPNPVDAATRLHALLSGSASIAGVTLTQAPGRPVDGAARLVGSEIVATGTEAGLTNFVSLAEHGAPAIRFRHWRLTASDGSAAMRFDGNAVAAWVPAR